MDAEVAVVGLGAMGSMTAWRLAAAGSDVLGFDQFGIGDPWTAAGESRALVRALVPQNDFLPPVDRAIELWQQLAEESGCSLYVKSGTLVIGKQSSARMRAMADAAAGFGFEVLDHHETRRRYPAHIMATEDIAVFENEGGVLRSELAVVAAARLAENHGARLVTGHSVERIESGPGGVTLEAAGQTYRVRRAVVTPGAWTSTLLPELAPHVTARRCVTAWWAVDDAALFTPERFPSFVRSSYDTTGAALAGKTYFGFPSLDGASVKFARSGTYGPVPPTDRLDQHLEDSIVEAHRARLRATLTGLHDQPHRIQVTMDGFTPDRAPVLGPLPGKDNIILATGFSGTGFQFASAIGDLLAGIATSGTVPDSVARLSVTRFAHTRA
ncbi:MAG TPA: N-methyl-L-tryptophan oxidase [Pseudonocardiaceae bacterium]|nr:N-methyl-L-tryptophan oxidase [Pseudonocardiaceae bacterium]